jgi:DNA-3-methyladenine glycosylase II
MQRLKPSCAVMTKIGRRLSTWSAHVVMTPRLRANPNEALVRGIAYQQLTAKAGDAMIDRLKALAGSAFPTPDQITALDPMQLRACGFSFAKAATIQAIAQGAADGVVPTRVAADQMEQRDADHAARFDQGRRSWTVES